jgi:hypothetical protein
MRTIDLVTGRTHGANDPQLGIEEIDPSSCGGCQSDCVCFIHKVEIFRDTKTQNSFAQSDHLAADRSDF